MPSPLSYARPLCLLWLAALSWGCGAELNTSGQNNVASVCDTVPTCPVPPTRCSGDTVVQGNFFVNPLTCACEAGADTLTSCAPQGNVCEAGACVPDDVVTRAAGPTDLVITEVFHTPSGATPEAPLTARRWVELYNTSDARLDLAGNVFSNSQGQTATLGAVFVPPRSYIVLGPDASVSVNGDVLVGGTIMGVTLEASDTLTLSDAQGEQLVTLSYGDEAGWPEATGASLQFDGAQDPTSTYSGDPEGWCVATQAWRAGGDLGTPGAPNTACDPDTPALTLTLGQVSLDTQDPAMIRASVTIEVKDESGQPVQAHAVTAWGPSGQALSYDHTSQAPSDMHTHTLPASMDATSNPPATLGPWLVPGASYDYQVTVTANNLEARSALKTFTVPDAPQPATWTNTLSPPTLTAPTVQVGLAGIPEATWQGSSVDAQGTYHRLEATPGQDLIVDLRGVTLTQPLHIVGQARNVVVLGGLFDMQTPADGAPGTKDQSATDATRKNAHPRLQSNRALHIACTHTSWVEGAHFKLNGLAAHAVVTRLGEAQTAADGHANRRVYLVNTRAEGMEGTLSGIRGGLLTNEGAAGEDAYHSLWLENLECLSSFDGVVFKDWTSALPLTSVYVRQAYFDLDPTYATDQMSALPREDRPDFVGGPFIEAAPGLANWDVQGLSHRNMNDGTEPQAAYVDTSGAMTPVFATQDVDGVALNPVGETTAGAQLIPGTQDDYKSVNPPGTLPSTQHAPADEVGAQYDTPFDYSAYGL